MHQKALPSTKQYADLPISLKGIDEKNRTITGIVASDGLEDRHGEKLNPNGWQINDHVPLFWGHDYSQLPVGKTTREEVRSGQLIVDGFLSMKLAFAKDLFDLITEGIVDKVSVGFIPKAWDESGEYTYSEQELLEVSFVGIPANPRAGIKAKIKSVEEGLQKLLEIKQDQPEADEEEAVVEDEIEKKPEADEVVETAEEVEEPVAEPLTAETVKQMIAEAIAELKSADDQAESQEEPEIDPEEVEEPVADETLAKQLVELRDALRGNYAGTTKTLEQINKYLKKG